MKLVWSETARRELLELNEFLTQVSGRGAARATIGRIVARGGRILGYPHIGKIVEDFNSPSIREVVEKPYRIVYEINQEEERVEVVAVFHGARRPPWKRDDE